MDDCRVGTKEKRLRWVKFQLHELLYTSYSDSFELVCYDAEIEGENRCLSEIWQVSGFSQSIL